MPIKKSSWFKPYTDGKPTMKPYDKKGVYLIKKNGVIVYVGKSHSCLKKTLYRHFQTWTDNRNAYTRNAEPYARITYKDDDLNKYLVRVVYMDNNGRIDVMEQVLINKIHPRDNTLKLALFTAAQERRALADLEEMEDLPF